MQVLLLKLGDHGVTDSPEVRQGDFSHSDQLYFDTQVVLTILGFRWFVVVKGVLIHKSGSCDGGSDVLLRQDVGPLSSQGYKVLWVLVEAICPLD